MTLVFCMDDRQGMMFGGRRQSRDRVLLEDLTELSQGHRLLMNKYSDKMFASFGFHCQTADDNFLNLADEEDFCFVEDTNKIPDFDRVSRIIIYRWNRHYPSDLRFDHSLLSGFILQETKVFQGNSHDEITREVYIRSTTRPLK